MVIGSGMSGLGAAMELKEKGKADFEILEAKDRTGGRTWTAKLGDVPIDLGASWFHGTKGNPLYTLGTLKLGLTTHEGGTESEYFCRY